MSVIGRPRRLGRLRRRPGTLRWRPRPRLILAIVAAILLLGGGWLWFKDSSLVAVRQVKIIGLSGADAPNIRAALIARARTMTTLDVRQSDLQTAVTPYPVVRSLRVITEFPHGMRIYVSEQIPVGAILLGGQTVPVAGDGKILHDANVTAQLPLISLRIPPAGSRLTDPDGAAALSLLTAAPWQMLSRLAGVRTTSAHGLVAQLRNGPALRFGGADNLAAKWAAADAVLADPRSAGAVYIDVSDPARPAAGSGVSPRSLLSATTG